MDEGSFAFHLFILWVLFIGILAFALLLILRRRKTRLLLSTGKCGLPTVCWMPRFVNYHPDRDEDHIDCGLPKKMPSSNITNILPRMERLGGPYGMYATVYGVSTKVLHVAHPVPAKAILMGTNKKAPTQREGKKRSSIAESLGAVKTPAYDHFKNFSGDGVFTADGNEWKSKRASLLHCLLKGCTKDDSKESLRMEREANRAANYFITNATSSPTRQKIDGKGDDTVNIVPILQRATIGLIFRFITHNDMDTVFGEKAPIKNIHQVCKHETTFDEESDDTEMLDDTSTSSSNSSLTQNVESTNASFHMNNCSHFDQTIEHEKKWLSSYLDAITNIRMIILAQSRSIWFLLPRWFYQTFSSMFHEEEKQMVLIRKFALAACENSEIGSPLQMLRSKESHNPTMDPDVKNGKAVNRQLLDEAITLLFAGQDTSAATISWTLHLLSLYPDVQSRLAKEVRRDLISMGYSRNNVITKRMISKMPYLDAVIKESMRLYPVAPFVVRRLPDDLSIPAPDSEKENIIVPKDTFACIWIYGLHRNGKLWHKAEDFVPDRWIDPELQKLDEGQIKYRGTFMPFAAGPRNCVGQPLAQVILRIILAKIMNECEIIDPRLREPEPRCITEAGKVEMAADLRKDMQAGFTVLPCGGVNLLVNKVPDKSQ